MNSLPRLYTETHYWRIHTRLRLQSHESSQKRQPIETHILPDSESDIQNL